MTAAFVHRLPAPQPRPLTAPMARPARMFMWYLFNRRLWAVLLTGLAALVALAPAADAQRPPGRPPAPVDAVLAEAVRMAAVTRMPGTVISRNDSTIAAAVAGRVDWIAEVGSEVAQGDVLARIDDRDWRLQERESVAQIKRLEARLGYEEAEVARIAKLADQGNAPQARLEEVMTTRDATVQELAQARVALERARVGLDRAAVRAPFPGRVVARLAAPGEYASPGGQLLRLVDTTHLEVRAQIPVSLTGQLAAGTVVGIEAGATRVDAPVRTIVPVGDEVSRTVELRVTLDGAPWIVGTAVRVAIPKGAARQVVAVPRDALILRADGSFVFVIEDGRARRVAVRTGTAEGDRIAVDGALGAGDLVIVRGAERLTPGQPVRIREGDGAAAGAAAVDGGTGGRAF
ncbi:hypothetical protein CCR80_02605 [Rhodothalassium salexigens]|nr:hypothetical protein [Rhodothalassium salexigens]